MYSRRKEKSVEGESQRAMQSSRQTLDHLEIGISKEWLRRLNGKAKISKCF
jgi:hypothetical protein